jgi:hypothetical protein
MGNGTIGVPAAEPARSASPSPSAVTVTVDRRTATARTIAHKSQEFLEHKQVWVGLQQGAEMGFSSKAVRANQQFPPMESAGDTRQPASSSSRGSAARLERQLEGGPFHVARTAGRANCCWHGTTPPAWLAGPGFAFASRRFRWSAARQTVSLVAHRPRPVRMATDQAHGQQARKAGSDASW